MLEMRNIFGYANRDYLLADTIYEFTEINLH